MSLFSLGADAANRKSPAPPAPPPHDPAAVRDAGAPGDGKPSTNPLAALAMFVPAETVAIFVTVATALLAAFSGSDQIAAAWVWYAFCILLTPVFAWIGFATTWRKNNNGSYPKAGDAPWFRIVASMVAFAAWGLAVAPKVGSAILCPHNDNSATAPACNAEALSGILVIVVGVILTALDGLIDYTPKKV
jgi:hypothetical protein